MRTCGPFDVDSNTVRRIYKQGDEGARAGLRHLAAARRRFGCRRLGILLQREGLANNEMKLLRLYRERALPSASARLQVWDGNTGASGRAAAEPRSTCG